VLEPLTEQSGSASCSPRSKGASSSTRGSISASGVTTLSPAQPPFDVEFDGKVLATVHGPRYRMLVIGASQLSKYLAEIAVGLDYQVTICDPRVEYTETWDVPGVTLVRTMPDDTVQAMRLDERCAVIALTHDPKLDDLALMEALKSPAFYVGALGSRANNSKRRERLLDFDLSADEIARLHWARSGSTSAAARRRNRHFDPRGSHRRQERRRTSRRRLDCGAKEKLAPSVACETQ
jgi:xanthine dehydrogenase accessory factor